MKRSRRARRIERHYNRMHRAGGLNLVSLMDIFTILVFFLMVNSSDVKVMQQAADVALPVSESRESPEQTLVVEVVGDTILIQGRSVARLDADSSAGDRIDGLYQALSDRRGPKGNIPEAGLAVTVMADRGTEYRRLRRIMQTCVDAEYRQVRLAVQARQDSGEAARG
ncbi:biopolymer transport protein ExbD [Tamilnaduibacter salinus]|uniref:Biopolymer transport protein ExbD n=1 Tax=Tamilnaduibacter salinus TaxID=1484056 RepID=A0A2A2I5T2_9GAMM|nr:biopolymer transporter ExbD [Tamilnaduibacter salinus]PAV27007.1 biopolymer transporter ExbD [Tamilnaduibacter salinus]PVY78279.1 biopolymer transport protein ExbD [Tamilnaduibacter salinus]